MILTISEFIYEKYITGRHIKNIIIYMKALADDYIKLSIFKLNQHTPIRHTRNGNISWGSDLNPYFELNYSVYFDWMYWEDSYMDLRYKDYDANGNKIDLCTRVSLTMSPCHYGGERFWFLCPGVTKGIPCKRRVGVLYKPERGCPYFACLHCYELTYASSNVSGKLRSLGIPLSIPEINKLKSSITKEFYKDKITKKCNKYITEVMKFKNYHSAFRMDIMKRCGRTNK